MKYTQEEKDYLKKTGEPRLPARYKIIKAKEDEALPIPTARNK